MKKILLFIIALAMNVAALAANPITTVMLSHQGNLTFFESDSIQAALTAALPGDTIFLHEGIYPGFTVTKPVTVRGAGTITQINGNINVNIPDCPTLTATLLENLILYYNGRSDININSSIDGLKIKQCNIEDILLKNSAKVSNAHIDRCAIFGELEISNRNGCGWDNLTVTNSTISSFYNSSYVSASSSSINLINCTIHSSMSNSERFRGNLMNCIIKMSPTFKECVLINCLLISRSSYSSNVTEDNCYYDSNISRSGNDYMLGDSVEWLQEKGYIGNDGTVVGARGGQTPFTLDPHLPRVSSHTLNVDNAHKTLNVTVKLSE